MSLRAPLPRLQPSSRTRRPRPARRTAFRGAIADAFRGANADALRGAITARRGAGPGAARVERRHRSALQLSPGQPAGAAFADRHRRYAAEHQRGAAQLIDERAGTTLREALRNVTGISFAAGEGGASGDNLTLRGFSARGDFFIEGLRDSGQYTRDPFYIDSVEVLKGPSSILFGRGSTGGVINQTLRLPQARDFGELALQGFAPAGIRSTADVNLHAGTVGVPAQCHGPACEPGRARACDE